MKRLKAVLLILSCIYSLPALAQPQADVTIKARVTNFYGTFGQTYAAVGLEPAITITPSGKPWAGGISYSKNILAYDASSDLAAELSLVTFHVGAKKAIGKYVHPFAYMVFGFRFMDYESDAFAPESNPFFTSFSLGYGARTGLQIGKGKWRFEGSLEYLSGTKARYLTPATYAEAMSTGKDFRDHARRSVISGITVGAGVAYILTWDSPDTPQE